MDNDKKLFKGLFLLTTFGIKVNCINDYFYISISFDRNPLNIVNYILNENIESIVNNILSNNDRRIYIEDVFHFYKYFDITSLLEDYLYSDDYVDKYSEYIYPVIENIKENVLTYGNLIINTPPDNILVNMIDLNNDKVFVTEVLLDIDYKKEEKINIKRKKFNNKEERKTKNYVEFPQIIKNVENYELDFNKTLNNYCYLILFYVHNSVYNIKISNNVKIIGDKYEIKYILKRIKGENINNEYLYRDFCPYFYEALFQFYLFDRECPDINSIVKLFKRENELRYIIKKIQNEERKRELILNSKIYSIKTEYNFLITLTWTENKILYGYMLNYLKDKGLIYSMNIYESDDYAMFFNLTTDPDRCVYELDRYISSYEDIDVLYIVSYKSKNLDFSSIFFI